MDVKDITTLLVALYGAGLATYVAFVQRKDKKPQVEARLSLGFLTHGPHMSDEHVLLTAANIGERNVMLSSGALLLPDGSQVITFADNATERFPHQLEAGKSMTMWFELRPLVAQIRARGHSGRMKVRAKFCDQTSREFISKPMELDLSQWA